MGVGRGSGLLGTFLCSRLLQNMKFLMPNADYHCAPFLNELHCLFKRIFFFRTDKGKTPKAPQSVMFWGCGTDSLLPPHSSRFVGRSVNINMKLGNAKTLSVSDHLCGRLIPKKSKADTELSPNVFEVICPISEASEATSTKRSFFFLLSFSSFALQEERDGDKRNYSDWRLGCHRRSVLIAVAVTVLLCTNN